MKRIDTASAEADTHGAGKDGFTNGTPGVTAPTLVDEDWLNGVQEEILGIVEGEGMDADGANLHQMRRALEVRDMLAALSGNWRISTFSADMTGGVYATAAMDPHTSNDPVSPDAREIVACGDNAAYYNEEWGYEPNLTAQWSDAEAGTADYRAAAAYEAGNAIVCVGLAGAWARITYASTSTGTISGTPGLSHVFWDAINSLWWACGAGGIYKAADAGSPSWTQVSATSHLAGAVLPSGRVVFWRDGDDKLYYTDDLSTLTAGATLGSTSGTVFMESDASVGLVISRGRQLFISADGTAASGGNFTAASTTVEVKKWRGEIILLAYGASAPYAKALIAKASPTTTLANWIGCNIYYQLTKISFADTFAVARDSGNAVKHVLISPALPPSAQP